MTLQLAGSYQQDDCKVDFLERQIRQDRQKRDGFGGETAIFLFFSLALLASLAVFSDFAIVLYLPIE